MKKTVARLICKFGAQLCAVAMVIAPLVSDICRNKYYQPEEPEGFMTFRLGICDDTQLDIACLTAISIAKKHCV